MPDLKLQLFPHEIFNKYNILQEVIFWSNDIQNTEANSDKEIFSKLKIFITFRKIIDLPVWITRRWTIILAGNGNYV